MTFFEFINQLYTIIENLPISFWISVVIISPVFMWFEQIIQTLITKLLYVLFIDFPKNTIQH